MFIRQNNNKINNVYGNSIILGLSYIDQGWLNRVISIYC
jgi:hypothetical protein